MSVMVAITPFPILMGSFFGSVR